MTISIVCKKYYDHIMKKIVTILILLISVQAGFSQKQEKQKKINALKTAHITNELNLSAKEAEKFWPIYNASQKKEYAFRKQLREMRKKTTNHLTEKEAQNLLAEFTKLSDEIHLARKSLLLDLQPVLSAKKIILLRKAEEDFKRKLFKQFKDKQKPASPSRKERY